MMRIGIAADHGGLELKLQLTAALKVPGYEVADFGAHELVIRLLQYFFYAKVKEAPADQPAGSGTQKNLILYLMVRRLEQPLSDQASRA